LSYDCTYHKLVNNFLRNLTLPILPFYMLLELRFHDIQLVGNHQMILSVYTSNRCNICRMTCNHIYHYIHNLEEIEYYHIHNNVWSNSVAYTFEDVKLTERMVEHPEFCNVIRYYDRQSRTSYLALRASVCEDHLNYGLVQDNGGMALIYFLSLTQKSQLGEQYPMIFDRGTSHARRAMRYSLPKEALKLLVHYRLWFETSLLYHFL
jgi:hypothetical protein